MQGLILEELKKDKKARKSYDEVLKNHPKDKEVLLLKSLLLQKMGKYYDAFKCYEKYLNTCDKKGDFIIGKEDECRYKRCLTRLVDLK